MTAAAPPSRGRSAHVDTFARDHLPPLAQQPAYVFDLPALQFPPQLNCAVELLDRAIRRGWGERPCIVGPGVRWTYAELQRRADAVAHVLVAEMGVRTGERVLLRAPNNPMLAACWFGVMKAGAIAVATMPLLRAKELRQVVAKARVTHALCDRGLAEELALARPDCPTLAQVRLFNDDSPDGLEAAMARHARPFEAVDTAADDTCLLAFTSGTTGLPKATMHYHQDVMAICACWPPHVLRATADDVFIGSPPLGFTFGLGGLLLFPLSVGASTVLFEKAAPPLLLAAIAEYRATVLFTAPTTYRAIAAQAREARLSAPLGGTLRKCVAAGEALPAATRALWQEAVGIEIIDGIGSTEMLHIFISADEAAARGGATGVAVPGYQACILDENDRPAARGVVGRLAVRGPTGCRYLDDERQAQYVRAGWNVTGDAYLQDEDGYYRYQARTDDMIISAGYNIAAPEVESVLLEHPAVGECAVIGVPDDERGQIVKAFVVLRAGYAGDAAMVRALQEFAKAAAAPYKYPRAIEFRTELPRTATGKLQRFRLKPGSPADIPGTVSGPEVPDTPVTARDTPMKTVLQPAAWPRPRGYANGIAARGRQVFVAGMIGWTPAGVFESDDLVDQVRQALINVRDVLAEAGAEPAHMARMTWYVVDRADYLARNRDIGAVYREVMGHYDVAMTAVEVRSLMEARAKVEIEVTAVVPDEAA